jgi:hypothetical protein
MKLKRVCVAFLRRIIGIMIAPTIGYGPKLRREDLRGCTGPVQVARASMNEHHGLAFPALEVVECGLVNFDGLDRGRAFSRLSYGTGG